ncbi:cytochrome P450 [Halioxenophilus sp. WMMB6]|uniref:cytochrome P450 n=1 Tax=Halioxenophilus sp. WMMB6 TaxID=3073815 RepID=UPI00295EF3F7|nr:cytochrome P450 [Halioxenophilus sp. WMMB6]
MNETNFKPDLKDALLYHSSVPHDTFARLRAECPVYWNEEADGAGFWAITKYEDISAISKNPQLFSSAHKHGGHRIFNENEVSVANSGESGIGTPLISMDPPNHTKYRVMAMKGLAPARIDGIEERIVQRAESLLDQIDTPLSVEMVSQFCAPLPLLTLCELMDVPSTMWTKLYDWTNCLVGEDDPDFRPTPEEFAATMGEFLNFCQNTFEKYRLAPDDSLASVFANAEFDGNPISYSDFLGNMVLLLVGGNETTRNSLSNSLIAFAQNPEQWQKLRSNPDLMPVAVREMMRYSTPVMHMRRTATEDTEIRGQRIRKGDKVVMWYASGNRDEDIFDSPHTFNIERKGPNHLAFGTGTHMCLGSRLGELQIRVAMKLLTSRYSDIELLEAPERIRSNFINGIKTLKLRLIA